MEETKNDEQTKEQSNVLDALRTIIMNHDEFNEDVQIICDIIIFDKDSNVKDESTYYLHGNNETIQIGLEGIQEELQKKEFEHYSLFDPDEEDE